MQSLEINTELKNLIPPLTEDEYQRLEKSIVAEGCRDAIVVWNGIIVDGHNRYEICKKHGLIFAISEKEMPDIEAVKEWIILNQFGRRNLSTYDRSLLALKLEGLFREKAKGNLSLSGGDRKSDNAKSGCQISDKAIDTKRELAKIAGVSHDTIAKVKVIDSRATPEQKVKVKTGKISINQAYVEI